MSVSVFCLSMLCQGAVTGTVIRSQSAARRFSRLSRGSRSPGVKCLTSEEAKRFAGCEVTLGVEGVLDGGMNRQEALPHFGARSPSRIFESPTS